MLIIVEVELLIDALTVIILGVRTGIDVGVTVDVNVKMCEGVITDIVFAMPDPLGKFRC